LTLSYFGTNSFKVKSKLKEVSLGEVLYYKKKEGKDVYYGNVTAITNQFKLKGLIEEKNFLFSWAEGWLKQFKIGSLVDANLEIEKEFGNLYKITDLKLTGFV